MQKNIASQQFVVFAFDTTTNLPETGDAANISATISKDFAADVATNDVNPTETQGGFYVFDATQAETNADDIQIFPSSVTANIQVISVPGLITTVPATFADDVVQTGDSFSRIGVAGAGLTNLGASGNNWNVGKTGYTLTQSFPANFSALGISVGGAIDNVTLTATCTTNTDMRGTDSANTTTPPTAAAIVNEWESQSQLDPTGFHVNVMEVNSVAEDIATETKQDIIDANIDAVKVKTDQMTYTNANELDANTKSINDAEVIGDGNATPWDGV